MQLLGCSLDEAKDVIRTDKEIDQGKRVYFDLSAEQEKEAKKWARTGTRKVEKEPTVYKWEKKTTRKANPTKENIISWLAENLPTSDLEISNLEILNKGKLIAFSVGETNYELDLKQKRK